MNYAIYTGRITKDLQLKQTQSGRSVLSLILQYKEIIKQTDKRI